MEDLVRLMDPKYKDRPIQAAASCGPDQIKTLHGFHAKCFKIDAEKDGLKRSHILFYIKLRPADMRSCV
jgi:hypothetical protein